MKRFFATAIALSSIFVTSPAMTNDYGATTLGTDEQLIWRFIDSGSNHSRISRGSQLSGYACRIQSDSEATTIDHYQIMTEAGSDYLFLQATSGTVINRSGSSLTAKESTPEDERTILSKATLAPGNFWYENNAEPSQIGEIVFLYFLRFCHCANLSSISFCSSIVPMECIVYICRLGTHPNA